MIRHPLEKAPPPPVERRPPSARPGGSMPIDFALAPEHEEIRDRVRDASSRHGSSRPWATTTTRARCVERLRLHPHHLRAARQGQGRAGSGSRTCRRSGAAWASATSSWPWCRPSRRKTRLGPWVLNCMAPDEGNMHTLLHWATDEQKEKYLKPLCEGVASSCFAMTEPEVAGSDPTLIRTHAEPDGDEWVINGHKWFISERPALELRHPHRPHRARRARGLAGRRTPRSSSTCPPRAGTTSARSRPCTARPATARS